MSEAIFKLLACIYMQSRKNVDSDQLVSHKVSQSRSALFSKQNISMFSTDGKGCFPGVFMIEYIGIL